MAGCQFHPGGRHAVVKTEFFSQFLPGKILHDVQHNCRRNIGLPDLLVTMFLGHDVQIKRRNCVPETAVVHQFQPLFNIIYIFETSHLLRIPQTDSPTQ